jgi:4-hydroxybenzoate polyprenyltransferase
MNPVSIQKFQDAQKAIDNKAMLIPIVAVGPAIAAFVLSLAQIVHGLAMAAFYAIKERNDDERPYTNKYLESAKEGVENLGLATLILTSLGLASFGVAVYQKYNNKTPE